MPEVPKDLFPVDLKDLGDDRFELVLVTGRRVEIKRLNGFEQLAADDFCGPNPSDMRVSRTYGICMLRKIDGREVAPMSHPNQFEVVARELRPAETMHLARVYGKLEMPQSGQNQKNESSAAGE